MGLFSLDSVTKFGDEAALRFYYVECHKKTRHLLEHCWTDIENKSGPSFVACFTTVGRGSTPVNKQYPTILTNSFRLALVFR